MDITEELNNINNFIKYLSIVSQSVTDKAKNDKRISIQEYNIVKNLSKLITNYFNNNDIDDIDDIDINNDNDNNITEPFLLKLKNNELSKENLIAHNIELDKKTIIFNLNCYNY
jgi:hypothetical protein